MTYPANFCHKYP